MKKSLLALSAAALAFTGMAANPMQMPTASSVSLDRSTALQSNVEKLTPRTSAVKFQKAPAKVSSADVITEVEGTRQNMTATGSGFYAYWFWVMQYENQSVASHVVYGENNEVYFCDFMPNAATGTYVKGVKDGDKVVVDLGQVVTFNDEQGYGLQLAVLDYVEEEDPETGEVSGWYYTNEEAESVTFAMTEDGGMVLDSLGEDQLLGYIYTDDLSWSAYGVYELSMVTFNEVAVTPPADYGVVDKFFQVINGDTGYSVNWAPGFDDWYLQGLSSYMPEAWVKGNVTYDESTTATIAIPQLQYVGIYSGMYIYTMCAKLTWEDGQIVDAEIMPEDYCYELNWDMESNTVTAKDPEVTFILNAAKDRIYYLQLFDNLKMIHQEDFAGTPANPYNLSFNDTLADYGYSGFYFTVPSISTEGTLLDSNDLYYVVYVDGDEWTFEPEEYGTDEAIEEVPWDLALYYIYHLGGAQREVDFFVEGITTLGVQSVYKYNDEETRSDIVSINLEDGVEGIAADKKIASVKYYGIDGREVANPAAGIFVKRVTFEDGSVATFKKAVR